jgi:hypothetical protein
MTFDFHDNFDPFENRHMPITTIEIESDVVSATDDERFEQRIQDRRCRGLRCR